MESHFTWEVYQSRKRWRRCYCCCLLLIAFSLTLSVLCDIDCHSHCWYNKIHCKCRAYTNVICTVINNVSCHYRFLRGRCFSFRVRKRERARCDINCKLEITNKCWYFAPICVMNSNLFSLEMWKVHVLCRMYSKNKVKIKTAQYVCCALEEGTLFQISVIPIHTHSYKMHCLATKIHTLIETLLMNTSWIRCDNIGNDDKRMGRKREEVE